MEEDPRPVRCALLVGALGALGLLPGTRGAFDDVALLAWLALLALPAGVLAGSCGARPWPTGLLVPGLWAFALVPAALLGDGPKAPLPLAGLGVCTGIFLSGLALGARLRGRGLPWAGGSFLFVLFLTGFCVRGALARDGAPASHASALVMRAALELSPLVLVLESSGIDWTHSQPTMYTHSGVEWIPRRSYRGPLAASTLLLVGSLLALSSTRRRGRTR